MRKTSSAVCTLDHGKGVSSNAASYKCLCLFRTSFQTSLCKLVHEDTVSQSNISRRWLWQQEKTWEEKTRSRTQRNTLCEPARVPEWTQNADNPERRHTFRASLRSRNACQHFTKATWYGNFQENATPQKESRTQTNTLCEPTHSKRMSKFHKSHFRWKFRSKMPRPRVTKNPDQAPAFTDTIRTPSVDTLSWEQSLTSMLFHPTSIFWLSQASLKHH